MHEYNCFRRCVEICEDELEHKWIHCKVKGLDPMREIIREFYWAADTFVWLQYFCFEICELRDIFLRKTGSQYLYFPGPLDEQSNTKWRSLHDLVFGPKKDETE